MGDEAGADGVAFDVGESGPEVTGAERAGEVAVLPEVADAAVAGVVVLGVATLEAAQEDGEGVGALREGDEVDMVGHEAPAEEADAGFGQVLEEEGEVGFAVGVGGKGVAAVDAALGDVAGDAGQKAALAAGHIYRWRNRVRDLRNKWGRIRLTPSGGVVG
jgi:hypothetical protein